MSNLFLNKKNIKELSSIELSVLLALNGLCNGETISFSNYSLQYYMFNKCTDNRSLCESIDRGIQGLIDKNILHILYSFGKGKSKLYVSSNENIYVNTTDNIFMCIDDKIIKFINKIDVDAIKTFICIASSFNSITGVGYDSIDDYCKKYDLAKNTFLKYLKILEDNKILYVFRCPTITMLNNEIKTINNNYGLYKDKDKVIENAKRHVYKICKDNKLNLTNYKRKKPVIDTRSVSLRCLHLEEKIKNNVSVDKDYLVNLIKDCMKYNIEDAKLSPKMQKGFKDINKYIEYGISLDCDMTECKKMYDNYYINELKRIKTEKENGLFEYKDNDEIDDLEDIINNIFIHEDCIQSKTAFGGFYDRLYERTHSSVPTEDTRNTFRMKGIDY